MLMVLMKTILANFVVVGNGQVGAMDVNRVEEGVKSLKIRRLAYFA